LRTYLYADDAEVFEPPFKEDIQNLSTILSIFVEVTGLCPNFRKSFMVPIRCDGIDLDNILEGLLTEWTTFPLK
jgi:hypothetical protein